MSVLRYDGYRWSLWGLLLLGVSSLGLGSIAPYVFAGELLLTNGDRLSGELEVIKKDVIIWRSPTLGELSIDKVHIGRFSTARKFKVTGYDSACRILEATSERVIYRCEENRKGFSRVPLLTMANVAPYENHNEYTDFYRGKVSVAGADSKGNEVRSDWVVYSGQEWRRGDFRHKPELRYESESANDISVQQKYEVDYALSWFYQPQWFLVGDLGVDSDEQSNIDYRYSASLGMGYQFWQNAASSLSIEAGLSHVLEQFDDFVGEDGNVDPDQDPLDREFTSLSWSLNFDYLLPFSTRFTHEHILLYSLEESEDWEVETRTGISIPIGGGMHSDFQLEYDYDNLPPEGTKESDRKVSIGIGYEW
ncbi:DUF481 domain-containing protein [Marinibactrum halimedae]|uniref:DUF481 domain-containing protein n=1 Tax=Marinibactrum halimedae TaxID=1444977 RepID=A0AA37T8G8_9GAMM|nr:DUF481 domain-containing protein [Marinibactrum halimedae]MCD9460384.1 DUF481 domain-containing protein [Marinibactrum halimedae]GLS26822.1 hypothetical protein GCM10007877_25410 [Marinibactrum halimedae]